jgi:hypothetical protein
VSIEDDMKADANRAIRKYIGSDEFKEVTAAEYKSQIAELIKRSESNARWIAGLSIALVLAVFTAMLLLQYAEVRNKQADLYERYTAANDLVRKVNEDLGGIQTRVHDASQNLDKFLQDYPARLSGLESKITDAERRLNALDKGRGGTK